MEVAQIKDHQLLKNASAVSREYISKCDPVDRSKDPMATKKESYGIEVFLSIWNIVSCIDQLYFSVDMLSGYRSGITPEMMNRYDYIVFGIENYYLRLTSVFDRSLRLANVVFQFGLPERQCSRETIIKNAQIKGTKVEKTLIDLDSFTEPFRRHRNTVAHEETYSERDLDRLGSYYYLVDGDVGLDHLRFSIKKRTDDFIAKKKSEFKENLKEVERLVGEYFDALLAQFESKLSAFV